MRWGGGREGTRQSLKSERPLKIKHFQFYPEGNREILRCVGQEKNQMRFSSSFFFFYEVFFLKISHRLKQEQRRGWRKTDSKEHD